MSTTMKTIHPSMPLAAIATLVSASVIVQGYVPATRLYMTADPSLTSSSSSRRRFVSKSIAFTLGSTTASLLATTATSVPTDNSKTISMGGVANAVGPIKIEIKNPTYTASPCPKDKPIPGEKAMKGMRGLCVQVKAELAENSPKVSSQRYMV